MRSSGLLVLVLVLGSQGAEASSSLRADAGFLASPIAQCPTDLRYLNQVGGWQVDWPQQWRSIAPGGPSDQDFEQWKEVDEALDEARRRLEAGLRNQQSAPHWVAKRVLQQVGDLISDLESHDPAYFRRGPSAARWNRLLDNSVVPALKRYRVFLREVYVPGARQRAGMSAWSGGTECFSNAAAWWTSLEMANDEIEAVGRRWLKQTRSELMIFARPDERFSDLIARLRESDSKSDIDEEKLVSISRDAIARARAALPSLVRAGVQLPQLEVVAMPSHIRGSFPAGFYRPPDDPAPAADVINPSRPRERELMAEAIAFHEGIPGHHLFFAYPRPTSFSGFNAGLLEGWAIYAEYLADDIGLYSTVQARQGMLAKHLWAASRLVVEPAPHVRGWSRQRAIDYMRANTALAHAEIKVEVDRYIAMPGQSLSYVLGADFLLAERARAEARMGENFDLREFHHRVLEPGVRSLASVRSDIRTWSANVASAQARP